VASTKPKEVQLAEFLAESFNPEKLKRFVRFGPDGDSIVRRLPFESSILAQAVALVDEYRRMGYIDSTFFDRLADFRPGAIAQIRAIEELWVEEPGSSVSAEHTLSQVVKDRVRRDEADPLVYSFHIRTAIEPLSRNCHLI
jgi:hypothetical protein